MAAVVIAGWQFDWQVDHSEFFIDADLTPHTRIAGVGGRVVFPRFGPIFVRQRNRMENPEALSGSYIKSADIALHVLFTHRNAPRSVRRADDDGVAGDDWRSMESDVGIHQIDFLIIVRLQIDGAVTAKPRYQVAGFRIQRDQPVPRRDVENSFFPAITPIRQAASGQL